MTAVEDTEEEDEEEAEKDVAVVEAEKGAEEMMISEFSLRRFILKWFFEKKFFTQSSLYLGTKLLQWSLLREKAKTTASLLSLVTYIHAAKVFCKYEY